jgi:hypothetical protein
MKQTKAERKAKHINNLATLFGLTPELVATKLFKHLKAIERDGHKLATDYCNGVFDSTQVEERQAKLKSNLLATLKYAKQDVVRAIEFNWDARGYFLKLDDEFVRQNKVAIHTDMGGYGIICPEGI